MPRRSKRKTEDHVAEGSTRRSRRGRNQEDDDEVEAQPQQQPSLAPHILERNRAVAEREAARLARPEARPKATLAHADRKKSAVTSTPFGVVPKSTADKVKAEGWCGPFSVARQMIAEREEERRKQDEEEDEQHPLDDAMMKLEEERKRKQHPSILWKSNAQIFSNSQDEKEGSSKARKKLPSLYATRQRRAAVGGGLRSGVPSLYDLCIDFLVNNFEHVESVGFVDSAIRKRLAHELVARNTLNDTALQALTMPGMEALELVDASGISSVALKSCLEQLVGSLRYLALDQAGRCFGTQAAQILVDSATGGKAAAASQLQALAIGGAYCLKDVDAACLVKSLEPSLQSIEFKACPLVGELFCKSILDSRQMVLRELSLEDLTFTDAAWKAIEESASASAFWSQHLESLRLRRMEGLTDERLQTMLTRPGALRALDVGLNLDLSDAILAAIRASPCCTNGSLSELRLTGCKLLTAAGLQALFTVVPDMGPPPRLSLLDVAQCDYQAVTDEVVELVAHAASNTRSSTLTNPSTVQGATLDPSTGLVHLNIQGSSTVTDTALEVLVATGCGRTMQELNVSYCTKLSDQGLGYFVDHCGTQLKSLKVWGLAQISEVFLDGHKRSKDKTFEIAGAWMKKNSILTIR